MKAQSTKHRLGFSILEVLIAAAILTLVGTSMVAAYLTGERWVRLGLELANVQSIGRDGTEKILQNMRMAQSASVSGGGDQIQFVVDLAGNPDSPTLVTKSYSFSNGAMTYGPGGGGSTQVIMTNAGRIPGSNIFSVNGKVVTVNVRVSDVIETFRSATYSGTNLDIRFQVTMRNNGVSGGGGDDDEDDD